MSNEKTLNTNEKITNINHVKGFSPENYAVTITGDNGENPKEYLEVAWRKVWFHLKHPDGIVRKTITNITDSYVIIEAKVYLNVNDPEDKYKASAFAQRWFKPGDVYGERAIESAETGAEGRALANAGFGLQYCCDKSDKTGEIVDSPISMNAAGKNKENTQVTKSETPNTPKEPKPKKENNPAAKAPAETAAADPVKTDETKTNVPAESAPAAQGTPAYTAETPVDEICKIMTLEDAKKYPVRIGFYKGWTIEKVAVEKPAGLEWYLNAYNGPDNVLRAAAKKLIQAAADKQAG